LKYIEKFKKEKSAEKICSLFLNGNDRRGAGYLLPLKTKKKCGEKLLKDRETLPTR
jgi:hypothetical protein